VTADSIEFAEDVHPLVETSNLLAKDVTGKVLPSKLFLKDVVGAANDYDYETSNLFVRDLIGTAIDTARDVTGTAVDFAKETTGTAVDFAKETTGTSVDFAKDVTGAAIGAISLSNFKDCRDYTIYCCQEWNRFEYECLSQGLPTARRECSDILVAASNAGVTADSPGTCTAEDLQ